MTDRRNCSSMGPRSARHDGTVNAESDEQAMLRISGEFLEMPGLRLTCRQAQRLFGLGESTCARLLDDLVERGFLTRQPNGTYARVGDGWGSAVPPRGAGRGVHLKKPA
jgi:hypothetical protein